MDLYIGARSIISNLGRSTELAAMGMRKLHYHMKDTYYDANPANIANRNAVPGDGNYEGMLPHQRAVADARRRARYALNETLDAFYTDTRWARPLVRNVPIPWLRGYIREHVGSDYSRPFDPMRVDKYVEKATPRQMLQDAAWTARQIREGAQSQAEDMEINHLGHYRFFSLHGTTPAGMLHPDLNLLVFDGENNNTRLVLQMMFSVRKQYTTYDKNKEHIKNHILWLARTGKDSSVFKDGIGTLLTKMTGEAIENEPLTGQRGPLV
jgi:hypothetical protein